MSVNFEILRGYLNHDESMVLRFLHVVCQSIPEDLEKLRKCEMEGNIDMRSIVAHGIKTQCAYLGLEKACEIALKIENSEHANNQSLIENLEDLLGIEILELRLTLGV